MRAPPHPVRDDPAERTGQRTDEGTAERQGQGCVRELGLQQGGEDAGVPDEGAERADVQERDGPGVTVASSAGEGAVVGLRPGQVVHAAPGEQGRQQGERDEHQTSALEACAGTHDDDGRHRQLDDAGAEVAAGCIEPQRLSLLRLGEEEGDVRHRRGEVAAAKAGEGGAEQQGAERGAGLGDRPGERGGRQHQQEGGDDGPVAPAEDRHGERVGDPDRGADQAGEGDEPELLVQSQAEPGCGQVWHDHAPQGPDAEAEELGEDGDRQVAPGNGPAAAAPEDRVLRVPVVDPATRPVYGEAGAGDGTLRGCLQRGGGLAGGSGHRGSFSDGPAWAGPEKRRNVVFPSAAPAVKRP